MSADMPADRLPKVRQLVVVCAHPDDESFGLGALITGFREAGTLVSTVCFTHGEASSLGASKNLGEQRSRELACAARVLGIKHVRLLDFPDGGLTEVAIGELSEHVLQSASSADALLTFGPGGITGHRDHIRTTQVTVEAGRMLGIHVYAWAIPRKVAENLNAEFSTSFVGHDREQVDFAVELRRRLQLRSIRCHQSQSRVNPVLWRRLQLQGDWEWLLDMTLPGG